MSIEKLLSDDIADDHTVANRSLGLRESGDVFEALSSETGRRILQVLSTSPGTISEVAADLDLTLQNVSYHVDRLERVGLVERVGVRYSSKAQEMTIYASKVESLRIQFGSSEGNETTLATPTREN